MFVIAFVIVGGTCLALLNYLWRQKYNTLPPGPKPMPLFGNLLNFRGGKKLGHERLLEWTKDYPDAMTMWLGPLNPVVVLNSLDAAREALVDNQHDIADRPDTVIGNIFLKGSQDIIFGKYTPQWNAHKKLAMQAVRKIVNSTKLEEQATSATQDIIDQLSLKHGPVDLFPFLTNIVYNIIVYFAFGTQYSLNDPAFTHMIQVSKRANQEFSKSALLEAIPGGPKIPENIMRLIPLYRKLEGFIGEIFNFIEPHIKEHRRTFEPGQTRDILDAVLNEQEDARKVDGKAVAQMTDEQLRLIVLDIFSAGTNTTSTTLHWLCLHMTLNPDIQEKCHTLIKEVIGDRMPTLADRSNLPYVEACIVETLRLNPVAPVAVPHSTVKDTKLGKYLLPAKTTVLLNIYGIHMNEKYWKNPKVYDPNNFLDDSGALVKPQSFLPFGAGRRVCLGETLARNDLFLVATTLLQRVKFLPIPGVEYTLESSRADDLACVPPDYKVLVQMR